MQFLLKLSSRSWCHIKRTHRQFDWLKAIPTSFAPLFYILRPPWCKPTSPQRFDPGYATGSHQELKMSPGTFCQMKLSWQASGPPHQISFRGP